MKQHFIRHLLMFMAVAIAFSSCKKDAIVQPERPRVSVASIISWLDKQKPTSMPNKTAIVTTLQQNLDFGKMHTETNLKGYVVTVPINNAFRDFAKFSPSSMLTLVVLANPDGSVRTSHVAVYTPAAGSQQKEMRKDAYRNIFGTATNVPDGKYEFFAPSGSRQFNLEYKDGNYYSNGVYTTNRPSTQGVTTNSIRMNACIDWYLVTTYHFPNGSTFTTEEFVTRTCDGCDGGMNQTLCPPGDGIAYEYSKVTWRLWMVANLNYQAVYKVNTFTIYDNYFITNVGFGAMTKSNNYEATVQEMNGRAMLWNGNISATTYSTAKITYAADPSNPVTLPEASRYWTNWEVLN